MYPSYPPIPTPPAPQPDSTREGYGLQILAFIIRERVTCTCTDDQLAIALHVAPTAGAVAVAIGADKDRQVDYRVLAADAVADAKRMILETQRIRVRLQAEQAAALPQPAAQAPTSVYQVDDGTEPSSKVPRRPIAPSYPPGGAVVDIRF